MSLSTRSQPEPSSVYQSWYTAEELETLTHTKPLPKLPVYKYVFLPQDNTTSFPEQMRALQMIKNTLKTSHACFIAMEPGDFVTSHYIFGVLIDRSLFMINPMGESRHTGFYKYLAKAQRELHLDNIYISNTPIQMDKKAVTACGPICVELMWHFASLSAETITKTLESLATNRKKLDGDLFYNVVDISGTLLLPSVFDNVTDANYSHVITEVRAQHATILAQDNASLPDETFDERTLMNTILMDELDLFAVLEEETFQRLDKKFKQIQQTPSLSSTAAFLQRLPAIDNADSSVSVSVLSSASSTNTTNDNQNHSPTSLSRYRSNSSPTHFKPQNDTLTTSLLNADAPSDENEKSASCCCSMQ
jgi:hypothetical protein